MPVPLTASLAWVKTCLPDQEQGEEEEDEDGGGAGGEAGDGSHKDRPRLTLDGLASARLTKGTGL